MAKDILALTAKAFNGNNRYIVNEGGTRSGKTFATLTLLYNIAASRKCLISVVSETFPHLRKGAIRDFMEILQKANAWNDNYWHKTESTYSIPDAGTIEFFSVDTPGKVHGPARNHLFINEGQNISYDIARHLFVRTTENIFVDFNPTHEFWAHTELKDERDCVWLHSTYKDNGFLTAAQIREIEKNQKNDNWWRVYGLGLIGQLEGLVFTGFTMIDKMPDGGKIKFGMDFGYTNDPTTLIETRVIGENIYLDEMIYKTNLSNPEIVSLMKSNGVKPNYDEIIADSAEPKTIDEIYKSGFNIRPSVKGPDSIRSGINKIKEYKIHITKRSTNLIREFRNYTWATDKEGRATNKPIDAFNHGIDAVRYALSIPEKTETWTTA
jgi:phage terminase large subunit